MVVGRHRGSPQYVRMVLATRYLTDFRVRGVYSPAVLRELTKPWHGDLPARLWESQDHAERWANWLNEHAAG